MIHAMRKNGTMLCGVHSPNVTGVRFRDINQVSCKNCKKTITFKEWVRHRYAYRDLTDDHYPRLKAHVTGQIKIHRTRYGLMNVKTLLKNVVNMKNGEMLAQHLWVDDCLIEIKYNKGKDVVFSAVRVNYFHKKRQKYTLKVKNVKKYIAV